MCISDAMLPRRTYILVCHETTTPKTRLSTGHVTNKPVFTKQDRSVHRRSDFNQHGHD